MALIYRRRAFQNFDESGGNRGMTTIPFARAPRRAVMALGLASLVLAACGGYDERGGLQREDYEALMSRRGPEQSMPRVEPPIPDLQPILAAPTPPDMADQRRVTINVTDATPLRDVLIELARRADVDLELDPRIQGGVIVSARERPFAEVVGRIADLAGLRYTFENNVLRMELDEPYAVHYRMDMLNLRRTLSSTITANTDVFTSVGDGGAGGGGSSASITAEAVNDFWEEITEGMDRIIAEQPAASRLSTVAAQIIPTTPDPAATPPAEGAEPTPEAATAAPASETAAASDGAGSDNPAYYTLNRQAGLITVYAPQRQHKRVDEYLKQLRNALTGQVLIEAKVVEVTLNDEFRAGIDWRYFGIRGLTMGANLTTGVLPIDRLLPTASANVALPGTSFDNFISLMDHFGTSRTLSSPRLTVVNNETALLKVAENEVYFRLTIERDRDPETGIETRTYTSELNTVPIGLLMAVQPSINLATGQVHLNLRPTISRVVRRVEDPAVQLVMADINASNNTNLSVTSLVPVVEVREMDSVVTMDSGSVMVMGGLMQERAENEREQVPGLGDIPVAGNLFRRQQRATEVVELVIFLRATIVRDRDSVHPADIDLYNRFGPDPRPLAF